jgi:ribA/ribD-fused uncharacterized protein
VLADSMIHTSYTSSDRTIQTTMYQRTTQGTPLTDQRTSDRRLRHRDSHTRRAPGAQHSAATSRKGNHNFSHNLEFRRMAENSTANVEEAASNPSPEPMMLMEGPAHWKVDLGMTPKSLLAYWHTQRERVQVLAFYQDHKGNPWREFSNFYQKSGHSFDFVLPLELLDIAGITRTDDSRRSVFPSVVHCDFSEKAIMLCKAAVMGDADSYAKIAVADTPLEAKRLGRQVTPWDDARWHRVVCGIAVAVLRQKFGSNLHLRNVLLGTGSKVLCEATAHDKTWAIGVSMNMPKVYEVPARWKGSNILGWGLMQTREILRKEDEEEKLNQEEEY